MANAEAARPAAVFVDTTIQIARAVHSPEIKSRIRERLGKFGRVVTSPVVKQEYKRRLLKEARYLLELLDLQRSVTKVRRHLIDRLPPKQFRKRQICEQLVQAVDEEDGDEDLTERLRLTLRGMLRDFPEEFADSVDQVVPGSGCACAEQPIEKRGSERERYEFGSERCSKVGGCGIVAYLRAQPERLRAVLKHLQALGDKDKTKELQAAEGFLADVLDDPSRATARDPCLNVGDLLIALESAGVPVFYTLNAAESKHLCPPLGQQLLVRPPNPEEEDRCYPPAVTTPTTHPAEPLPQPEPGNTGTA